MGQEFYKRGQNPQDEKNKGLFSGVTTWVSEQIEELTSEEDQTEIKSTLDQDETEWAAPSWCNFAKELPEHNHAMTFANMDLRGRDMKGAHLMMADLTGVDAQGVSFANADLSFAEASGGDFRGANFTHADLCKIDLSKADLRSANLLGADLTQAVLRGANLCGARLQDACLESCDLKDVRYDSYTELPFSVDEANRRGMHNVQTDANVTDRRNEPGGIYE